MVLGVPPIVRKVIVENVVGRRIHIMEQNVAQHDIVKVDPHGA